MSIVVKVTLMQADNDGVSCQWSVFGDSMSVLNGVPIPESKLSNKYLGIYYHAVSEAYVAGIWKVGFVKLTHNISNYLNKILSGSSKYKAIDKCMWCK